ncbi:MAG: glycosyltransferase family 1 protein [Comamonadaceae bacterium]|nr:MAG: glycosyltransferase family 1 protein [Comamonadaceae bacterium]
MQSRRAMRENQSIWIDLTTSLQWTRPPVGIVRVEQECCRWMLAKLPDRVRICMFDASTGRFLEVQVRDALAVLNRNGRTPEPASFAPAATAHTPSVPTMAAAPPSLVRRAERLVRKATHAALKILPQTYQPMVRRYLIAARRTLAYTYTELKAAHAENSAIAAAPAAPQVEPPASPGRALATFQHGDSYLTMGLDWDQGNKLEALWREKNKSGLKVFSFAYDVIPVKFPTYYPEGKFDLFSNYFATMGWAADEIICISQCTARDLSMFLLQVGAPQPPMSVLRLGDTLPVMDDDNPSFEVAEILKTPFLLAVSTIEIRKNHETLYRAYLRLLEAGFDVPKLVLVGMTGWRVDDFMYAIRTDPRIEGKIVVLNHASDADLAALYKNCLFTLYPSLYEGWGLPVAESLAYGKFCLASSAASIPEIAGDILDYVDPWDVPNWVLKIQHYCSDPAALRVAEEDITARYRTTSWETTTDKLIAAIGSAASA